MIKCIVMKSQSKFLPDSVSSALKSITKRVCGAVILLVGLWALFAMFFHDSYMDGFATASNFGTQSFMGDAVAFSRYMIGFLPSLFLVLCMMRWGEHKNLSSDENFRQSVMVVVWWFGSRLLLFYWQSGHGLHHQRRLDVGVGHGEPVLIAARQTHVGENRGEHDERAQ